MVGAARAGTVHFDPPSAVITPGTPSVSFEVSVSTQVFPSFDTVNVILYGEEGHHLTFEYAQSFVDSTTLPPAPPCEVCCLYTDCYDSPPTVGFGGNNLDASPWTSPLLIGTLTVDTASAALGSQIEFGVDTQFEFDLLGAAASLVGFGASQDPLTGMATITVVSEPGMFGLLLVCTLAKLRRRGQAKRPLPHGRGTVDGRRCA